jgi:hypothetical protein
VVDRAFVLHLVGDQHVPTVEEQQPKLLDHPVRHRSPQVDD